MSYANLLTHRCDIYHLIESPGAGRFGVPGTAMQSDFSFSAQPDHENVPSYFTELNQSVVQGEPYQEIVQSFRVHFLPSADIRMNDKVVWEGVEYRLQKPRKIKNHHWEVVAVRSENL